VTPVDQLSSAERALHVLCRIVRWKGKGKRFVHYQTFSLDANEVAVAGLAPGSIDHVTEIVSEAVSNSDADQSTLVLSYT